MRIESYDYISGQSLGNISLNQLNFGDIIQDQHCVKPMVIRMIEDSTSTISDMRFYLENKGPWTDTEYGCYVSADFTSNIQSGSSVFTHLTEVPGATATSDSSVHIDWHPDQSSSDYVWLDAEIKQKSGMATANYRLFYQSI